MKIDGIEALSRLRARLYPLSDAAVREFEESSHDATTLIAQAKGMVYQALAKAMDDVIEDAEG